MEEGSGFLGIFYFSGIMRGDFSHPEDLDMYHRYSSIQSQRQQPVSEVLNLLT